jgi:hypothetical protein
MKSTAKQHGFAEEMATVDAVLASGATTRRTDAFVLTWVKMEKQLRRLFSFIVYQNPAFSKSDENALVKVFVDNNHLYADSFIKCINALGTKTVADLVGQDYAHYQTEIKRIKKYRNKILHGQITGENLQSPQLEKDIKLLRKWIEDLAEGGVNSFGYDGIARNTFRKAKAVSAIASIQYPFSTVDAFKKWLRKNAG